jgi:metal-responsive CopG/Arc/MetJ family transcriptional regulator
MFEKNLKRTSISLNQKDFKLFKQICKINNSDASKTIRQFIQNYISKNEAIFLQKN